MATDNGGIPDPPAGLPENFEIPKDECPPCGEPKGYAIDGDKIVATLRYSAKCIDAFQQSVIDYVTDCCCEARDCIDAIASEIDGYVDSLVTEATAYIGMTHQEVALCVAQMLDETGTLISLVESQSAPPSNPAYLALVAQQQQGQPAAQVAGIITAEHVQQINQYLQVNYGITIDHFRPAAQSAAAPQTPPQAAPTQNQTEQAAPPTSETVSARPIRRQAPSDLTYAEAITWGKKTEGELSLISDSGVATPPIHEGESAMDFLATVMPDTFADIPRRGSEDDRALGTVDDQ